MTITLLVFEGTNYQIWIVRMKAYLVYNNLWEVLEEVYEVLDLPNNTTISQIKNKKNKKQRKSK